MSGPDYPRRPASVAFDPDRGAFAPFEVWETVVSQYANSPILTQLVLRMAEYISPERFFEEFYRYVWHIDTAEGAGLDVWGRIVGVGRNIRLAPEDWFGFEEQTGQGIGTFDSAPFYSGGATSGILAISDRVYRRLILTKAAANITDGSTKAINAILMSLFPGRGNAYVAGYSASGEFFGYREATNTEGFDQKPFYAGTAPPAMHIEYVFDFWVYPAEQAIIEQSGVLPKPTGTSLSFKYGDRAPWVPDDLTMALYFSGLRQGEQPPAGGLLDLEP